MRPHRNTLTFATVAACVALGLAALAPAARPEEDPLETPVEPMPGTESRPDAPDAGGWKGLPGVKDPGEPGKDPTWTEIALTMKTAEKDLPFRTPCDWVRVGKTNTGAWTDVTGGSLPVKGPKGEFVRFQALSNRIQLDLDGDGSYETTMQGELASCQALRIDGSVGPYAFRLRRDDNRYVFTRACYVTGKMDGHDIAFVDENNNTHYGDSREDAVRLGGAPIAQYTSEVVFCKGKLYFLRVNQAGTKAWWKPFVGEQGTIDVLSKYQGKTKPIFCMLQQGEIILDVARKDAIVPAGTYRLFEALVGKTMYEGAKVTSGSMKPIVVAPGGAAELAWGMPGRIEWSVGKEGNRITISGASISAVGKAGEVYTDFRPLKFIPTVTVVDDMSKKVVFESNLSAGLSRPELPGLFDRRLETDKPWKARLWCETTFLGRFESDWQ